MAKELPPPPETLTLSLTPACPSLARISLIRRAALSVSWKGSERALISVMNDTYLCGPGRWSRRAICRHSDRLVKRPHRPFRRLRRGHLALCVPSRDQSRAAPRGVLQPAAQPLPARSRPDRA